MQYIIASSVSTDRIRLKDGSIIEHLPGGAGIYALAGLRLWTKQAVAVSGIGPEYKSRHQEWYQSNDLSMAGLLVRGEDTPVTTIDYRQEDDRTDSPDMGLECFRLMDPKPDEIKRFCDQDTKGIYFFRHLDQSFLAAMAELKRQTRCRLLWEIAEDAAVPENRLAIEEAVREVDCFSINKKEACTLYQTADITQINQIFTAYPCTTYFRQGRAGAFVISGGKIGFVPSVAGLKAVDTTGAGNSSSAGFLFGLCQGYDTLTCGCYGAVSAAAVIGQYGPPPRYTDCLQREAKQRLSTLKKEVEKRGIQGF